MVVGLVQLDDIRVADFGQDVDLDGEVFQLFLRLDATNLGRCENVPGSVPGLVDLSEGPVAEVADDFPDVLRVDIAPDVGEQMRLLLLDVIGRPDVQNFLQVAEERHGASSGVPITRCTAKKNHSEMWDATKTPKTLLKKTPNYFFHDFVDNTI